MTRARTTGARARSAARRAGFTLLEILVALAVMSLLFGAISGTLTNLLIAQRNVEAKLARERAGSAILEAIGRDLNGVYAYEIEGAFLGSDSGEEDRIEFISTRPPSFLQDEGEEESQGGGAFDDPDEEAPTDGPVALKLLRVGYFVQRSEGSEFLTLFRYEDRFDPPPPPPAGQAPRASGQAESPFDDLSDEVVSMEVYDRVRSFNIRYLDLEGNYKDSWSEPVTVPFAVEVTIEVVPGIEELQRNPDLVAEPITFQSAFGLPISVPDPEAEAAAAATER